MKSLLLVNPKFINFLKLFLSHLFHSILTGIVKSPLALPTLA
jgi:hypothetical protein